MNRDITTAEQLPTFDETQFLGLYRSGQHANVADQFLSILKWFDSNSLQYVNASSQHLIDSFVELFLFIFTQADFRLGDHHARMFIGMNRVISNLVAVSSTKNTDTYLDILNHQQPNLAKLLTLYSARNTLQYDRKTFFDAQPSMASQWYVEYAAVCYGGLTSQLVVENLRSHFRFSHPRLAIPSNALDAYFGSTYVDEISDRSIKHHINATFRRLATALPPVRNKPNPKKIAVLSAAWVPGHVVYQTFHAYMNALTQKYDLTLFELGGHGKSDSALFAETYPVKLINGMPDMTRLAENDFQAAYFPEIGMGPEGIILANRRLAPIQVCTMGHAASTWGADIDYFVSGADVEPSDSPERNYSERLVLMPGMGLVHRRPAYQLHGRRSTTGRVVINCPWSCQKLNYAMLMTLKKLVEQAGREVLLRLFVGASARRANDYLPFACTVFAQLGRQNVEIYTHTERYEDYMAVLEEGDLALDSFHFGGCNSVADNLFLGVPVVTWEGSHWRNCMASHLSRLVGLPECVDFVPTIVEG